MSEREPDPGEMLLKRVRLSFAALYQPQEGMIDETTGKKGPDKYKANFLIPKGDQATLKMIKATAQAVKRAKWGEKADQIKLKADRVCFRDGDLENWDGYEGHYYISANNAVQPKLIGPRKDPRTGKFPAAPPGMLYSGCYVNAVVRMWVQDSKQYGKRINASVEAVQFAGDGEPFSGARPIDAEETFEDVDLGGDDAFGLDDDDDIPF